MKHLTSRDISVKDEEVQRCWRAKDDEYIDSSILRLGEASRKRDTGVYYLYMTVLSEQ